MEWISDRQGSLGTASVSTSTGETTITSKIYAYEPFSTAHVITLRVTDFD